MSSTLTIPRFERVHTMIPESNTAPGILPGAKKMRLESEEFVKSASKVAKDVLLPENLRKEIGHVNIVHYSAWSPFWSPVYIIDANPGRTNRREDDSALRFIIGLAATICGGFAVYHLGKNINYRNQAEEGLLNIGSFQSKVDLYKEIAPPEDKEFYSKVGDIAKLESRIFKRIKNDATAELALSVSFVAGSALALIGSFMAAYNMINLGIVVGFIAGSCLLFKWALDSTDIQQARDAVAIQNVVRQL